MNKTKYFVGRIFDDEQLEYLRNHLNSRLHSLKDSRVTGKRSLNKDKRDSMFCRMRIHEAPDINYKIINTINEKLDEKITIGTHIVSELEFLHYSEGGKFKKHQDVVSNKEDNPRVYTTITFLEKSEDLEGGHLRLYESKESDNYTRFKFNVGDTAIFYAGRYHECTEILQGERKVLVGWVHQREKN